MKRILANISIMILFFVMQISVFPFIPFLSASPNFILLIVFSLSFINGKKEGMLYGLIAGMFMDLFYSMPFGYFILFFTVIAYFNGILSLHFHEDFIWIPLLMCFLNMILYNLYIYVFVFLIRAKFDISYYFSNIMLPEVIITLVLTLFIYRLLLAYNKFLDENSKKRGQESAN